MFKSKLEKLSNDQLGNIKGGEVYDETDEGYSIESTDSNRKFACSCDGSGDNRNGAWFCTCTDKNCKTPG
jgi:hypothetical protein